MQSFMNIIKCLGSFYFHNNLAVDTIIHHFELEILLGVIGFRGRFCDSKKNELVGHQSLGDSTWWLLCLAAVRIL